NIGMAIDTTANRSRPLFRQTYGPSIGLDTNWRNYTARLLQQPERSEETMVNAKLDYVKDFRAFSKAVQLKAGGTWRQQDRFLSVGRPNWTFTGADRVAGTIAATGANDDNLAQFIEAEPAHPLFDQRNGVWPDLPGINFPAVWRTFSERPEWFAPEGTSVTVAPNDSKILENVFGAYVQGRAQIGRLNAITGVRFEKTEIEAAGRYTDARNPNTNRVQRQNAYHDYFPSVLLRYNLLRNLTARASVTTGAARPNMQDLYPTTTVSYNATTGFGTVTQNDPGLRPQQSTAYDVSLEYYFEPAGLISVGFFRKDIKNFLVRMSDEIEFGSDNGFDGDFGGFTLSTTTNGGEGIVEGWEINYNQQLTMLPKPFNGLGLFANYTKLSTHGTYSNGERELAGFVPETANAGVSFRWRRLEARVSWRYTGDYLRSYNTNVFAQSRYRAVETTDISLLYKFSPRFAVYVDAINVGNNWPQNYTGTDPGRITFADDYGTRYNMGVSGRF
ncbi:MAG: TonB-dependent receptor, partial [Verrucomicrobiota bacterium]